MATIIPFKALRPPKDKAAVVACVPYDVIYDAEVRDLIEHNPLSFLRVTRPEGEYPESEKPSSEAVFERARRNLDQFIEDGLLIKDAAKAVYIYELSSGENTQTGVVACCAIDDYTLA